MKYKAKQLNNGNYAVFAGKSYYPDTETEIKEQAIKAAIEYSVRWYHDEAIKAFDKLVNDYPNQYTDSGTRNGKTTYSDIVC